MNNDSKTAEPLSPSPQPAIAWSHSEQIGELAASLAKAQGTILTADRDKKNPFYGSKYADLASCWATIRKPMSENGLAIVQLAETDGPAVVVTTILAHSSGQWISGRLAMTPVRQLGKAEGGGWEPASDPQAIGSAITYARRYALSAIAGVAADDDDGNAASGRKESPAAGAKPSRDDRVPPPKSGGWESLTPEQKYAAAKKRIEQLLSSGGDLAEFRRRLREGDYGAARYAELLALCGGPPSPQSTTTEGEVLL